MTSQLILQRHSLHPFANQLIGIFADLPVKTRVLQSGPCLADRPLFGPKSRKGGSNPQRPNVIAGYPGGLQLAQLGLSVHQRVLLAGLELAMTPPSWRKGFRR